MKFIVKEIIHSNFVEEEHPRAKDGKFSNKNDISNFVDNEQKLTKDGKKLKKLIKKHDKLSDRIENEEFKDYPSWKKMEHYEKQKDKIKNILETKYGVHYGSLKYLDNSDDINKLIKSFTQDK